MTRDEVEATIRRMSYKPGYSLSLMATSYEAPHVPVVCRVTVLVPDSREPGTTTIHHAVALMPPKDFSDEAEVVYHVRKAIMLVETHEMDEWLMLDGRRQRDPHVYESPTHTLHDSIKAAGL